MTYVKGGIEHYWTYNDVRLEDLDKPALIEALEIVLENNADMQDEIMRLRKDVIQAHASWRRRLLETVEGYA